MNQLLRLAPLCAALLLVGCNKSNGPSPADTDSTPNPPPEDSGSTPEPTGFEPREISSFDEPWAMTFLDDGRLLVTEKGGTLRLLAPDGSKGTITGVPDVDYGGQGGLGDVVLHPDFADNDLVYLSWAEAGEGDTRGAAVGRATLRLDDQGGGQLDDLEVLWRQTPKVTGRGHYGHRLAFGPDGHLFITSGDRQKFDPAQDMSGNLGKVIRLADDGSVPDDNPFQDQGDVARQVWTLGHRNPLGIAFDADGRLWVHEMGPKGGDELNLVERTENYGYPEVSNGVHYDGSPIPDHDTRPEFEAPKVTWTPVISPAGFVIHSGDVFPQWRGHGFIGGLSSQALIRVELDGDQATEAERWNMGERIREVEEGPDGNLYVLEDGSGARLLELAPTYD